MKTYYFIVIFIATGLLSCQSSNAVQNDHLTTFIIVRHAERIDDSNDSDLSVIGYERANHLDSLFSRVPFSAVFSTSYTRTRETVRPLAERNNLILDQYEHDKLVDLFPRWLENYRGGHILISGHSNTFTRSNQHHCQSEIFFNKSAS